MNLPLAVIAAVLGLGSLVSCNHEKPTAPTPAAVSAPIQIGLSANAIKLLDAHAARVAKSQSDTDEATNAVQATPSASDPLPDDLRAAWLAGIKRVRADGDQPLNAGGPAGADTGHPEKAMPAS